MRSNYVDYEDPTIGSLFTVDKEKHFVLDNHYELVSSLKVIVQLNCFVYEIHFKLLNNVN